MAIFGWGGRRRRPEADDRSTTTERVDASSVDAPPADARPVDASHPDPGPADDAVIAAAVRVALLPGFRTLPQVVDVVAAALPTASPSVGTDLDALRGRILEHARTIRAEAEDHSAASTASGEPSGYERLSDAFRTAAERGMIALMGVGVDVRAARDEVDRLFAEDPRPWAFVCFSLQDSDALADLPGDLLLTFGALRPDPSIEPDLVALAGETGHAAAAIRERSTLAAGSIVLDALADHGLDALWDGEIGQPIVVHLLGWDKPLPE